MWNLSFTAPEIIEASVLTRLPDRYRNAQRTDWSRANKGGQLIDCFLEGPSFDRHGNLWVVDIPNGRLFRIDTALEWSLGAQYDGWPNGSAFHRDGSLWIADNHRGLLRLVPGAKLPEPVLPDHHGESFKGLNDLTFDPQGRCLFTDQGHTGLDDPSGQVLRLEENGRLDILIRNAPSPNGLALSADASTLYLALTRANAIWRAPLPEHGGATKVGQFQTFFGTSGPDGLAVDIKNGVVVGHASLGGAFVLSARGDITHFVRSPLGTTVTNLAFRPGTSELIMIESQTGTVLTAKLPVEGLPLYSHA